MRIKFIGRYKSIQEIEWSDIPMFVVITGENGTGKTQLLELIDSFFRASSQVKNLSDGIITIDDIDFSGSDVLFLKDQWYLSSGKLMSPSAYGETRKVAYQQYLNSGRNQHARNSQHEPFFKELDEIIQKNRSEVSEDEFFAGYPKIVKFDLNGLADEIASQFCNYRIRELEYLAEGGELETFSRKNGERPWDSLNNILLSIDSPYQFTTPIDDSLSMSFKLALVDNVSKKIIDFNDLSSGEKVVMSLILLVLVSEIYNKSPRLILMDEPDAHLHPSLTKIFISSVLNILVKRYNCRVIMTTHSPSTVALCPEEYLFEMSRYDPRISKSENKQYLIRKLTNGLITVTNSTNYVLVEDNEDADFYTSVVQLMMSNNLLDKSFNIVFIPSAKNNNTGGGGKTVVKSWAKKLNDVGLDYLFTGLVDMDFDGAESSSSLLTTTRHSLENYLVDPLVIFTALLEDSKIDIDKRGIRVGNEFSIKNLPTIDMQAIADEIIDRVLGECPENYGKSFQAITYHNGKSINIPKWLVLQRGKDLVNLFRNEYGKKVNHRDLMKAFLRLDLLPIDLCDLIKSLDQ